nr:hypothetical protein HK105_008165 [Polyrhizophydium stewartii]
MLFDIILAANYLDMKGLLDLGCKTVAGMIKGKTIEEIRKQFPINSTEAAPQAARAVSAQLRSFSAHLQLCCTLQPHTERRLSLSTTSLTARLHVAKSLARAHQLDLLASAAAGRVAAAHASAVASAAYVPQAAYIGEWKSRVKQLRREVTEVESKNIRKNQLEGSQRVVILAITSNMIMFLAKLYGAIQSGSASMFSEALHSLADDLEHPYGFTSEKYAWALVSGVVTMSFAYKQIKASARAAGMTFWSYLRRGGDPSSVQVFLEDISSVTGVAVAGICLSLSKFLEMPFIDSLGSITIGILLSSVATFLIQRNISGLVEKSMNAQKEANIIAILEADPVVTSVHDVKSTSIGPEWARFKAEILFDSEVVARKYAATNAAKMQAEIDTLRGLKTDAEIQEWMARHGSRVVASLGAEVDRLELEIKVGVIRQCSGLVDYLYVYGCVLGGSPVLGGAFLALALLFLFVALAATAQHFFCPNLSSIATFLEMPESVSGVTIAALGNGAGDLFATFAAFKAGLVPLALGELFGAATFITCCVAGLVCIVKPSKLPRRSFLRDTIAFLGAAALVNAFVASGELSISKSLALIGYYIVYVIVVVVGAFMSQQSLHAAPSEAVVPERSPFLPRVLFGEEQAAGPAAGSAVAPSPLASAFGAMRSSSSEFMASNVSLVNETDFDTDFFLPHLKLSSSRKSPLYRGRSGALFIPPDASSLVQMRGNDPLFDDSPGVITPLRPSAPLVVTPEPGPVAAARVLRMPSIEEEILAYAPLRRPEHAEIYESLVEPILRRALPVVFKWQSMTLLHRLQAVLAAPVVALLTLAAPVVHEQQFDRADSNEGYERVPAWPADEPAGIVSAAASGRMLGPGPVSSPDVGGFPDLLVEDEATVYSDPDEEIISALTFLQVLVAPLSNLIEFGPTYKPYVPPGQPASPLPNRPGGAVSMMAMPVWVVALAAGAALAPAVCFVILPRLSTRTQLKALSVFGFLISMMFVATFSSELVVLLDAIGTLSGMSQTLLVRDIVVGIGFSSLYVTLTTAKPIAVAGMDAVFWISSAGLYIGLVSTLVYVVRNKFQVGEKLGAALLACYGVLIGLVVVYSSAAAVVGSA